MIPPTDNPFALMLCGTKSVAIGDALLGDTVTVTVEKLQG